MRKMPRQTLFTLLAAGAAMVILTTADFSSVTFVKGLAAAGSIKSDGVPEVKRPVVVELYTSQGCSSCPPADEFAGELAELPGVLPLSFHVDYWDYIGWKDPFASPEHTQRQRGYAQELSIRYVYTPQMVIDGSFDAVGFRRSEVFAAIARAAADQPDIALDFDGETGRLLVPAGEAPPEGATLWLAVFDHEHSTDIARGENAGRKLSYYNVVRDLRDLGTWTGEPLEIAIDLSAAEANDACVILLQEGKTGRILSAVTMELPQR